MPCKTTRDETGQVTRIVCSRESSSKKCEVCGTYTNQVRLCDYPLSSKATCDRVMCPNCSARPKGKDEDYCPDHRERAGLGKPAPKFDIEGALFISARYDGRCRACHVELCAGDQVFYMPSEKGVLCEPCAAETAGQQRLPA